ncbi:MAG: hypothetical protein NC187_10035 [Candidatus Amulumruptor caecigallinarius]|nr:hypothetical protein [Candidatus Amulumruptor caecigallinarius]MCM1397805.1 hypothetical protein [Candidatus Amulumruptor caecigallinarius]MCM1454852.1 hypothetical protein [bacterium]
MKKISMLAAAAGVMMGLASCESTTDPKLTLPDQDLTAVSFTINEPTYANELVELSDAEGATLPIVVYEQPAYGAPVAVTYTAQASLTGNWANPNEVYDIDYDITQTGEARHTMLLTQASVADALTALSGITAETDKATGIQTIYGPDGSVYTGPMENLTLPAGQKLHLRAVASLAGVEGTTCYSNEVTLDKVNYFIHFRLPGVIFLIGQPQGWNIGDGSMGLYENAGEEGTQVYYGDFNINAGDASFRFYNELGSWGNDGSLPSIGARANDGDNMDVPASEFTDGVYSGDLVYGKGNWQFVDWAGGQMYIRVNLSTKKITVSDAEID